MKIHFLSAVAALYATISPAAVVTNDQSQFDTATSGLAFDLEDFDTTSFSGQSLVDFGAFSISTPFPTMNTELDALNCFSGTCIALNELGGFEEILFAKPVNAVSFFIGNDDDSESFQVQIDGEFASEVVQTGVSPGLEPTFFGIYDLNSPFQSIRIPFVTDPKWHIDNVSYSFAPIPLPASLPLLIGSLGLFTLVGRRRKPQD